MLNIKKKLIITIFIIFSGLSYLNTSCTNYNISEVKYSKKSSIKTKRRKYSKKPSSSKNSFAKKINSRKFKLRPKNIKKSTKSKPKTNNLKAGSSFNISNIQNIKMLQIKKSLLAVTLEIKTLWNLWKRISSSGWITQIEPAMLSKTLSNIITYSPFYCLAIAIIAILKLMKFNPFLNTTAIQIDSSKDKECIKCVTFNQENLKKLHEHDKKDPCGNKTKGLVKYEFWMDKDKDNKFPVHVPPFFGLCDRATDKFFDFSLPDDKKKEFKNYYKTIYRKDFKKKKVKLRDLSELIQEIQTRLYGKEKAKYSKKHQTIKNIMNKCGKILRVCITSDATIEKFLNIKLINEQTICQDLSKSLNELKNLGGNYLAVRSSTSIEDSDNPAAGVFATKIGINNNVKDVAKAISEVVSSVYSENAMTKSFDPKNPNRKNKIGILIQAMFMSQVCGVVYSKSNFDPTKAIITIGPGQGDYLVSGKYTGATYAASRIDLYRFLKNDNTNINDIELEEIDNGAYNTYLYLNEYNKEEKEDMKEYKNIDVNSMAFFMASKSNYNDDYNIINKKLKESLKIFLLNCIKSEIRNKSARDQEIGIKIMERYLDIDECEYKCKLKYVLVQDRKLPQYDNKVNISEKDFNEIKRKHIQISDSVTPLTNGIGEGKMIGEEDFFKKAQKNELGTEKYIVLAKNNATNEMGTYINNNIAAIICKNGGLTDHMTNECNMCSIPLIRVSNYDIKKLEGKIYTIASILVDGKKEALIIQGEHRKDIVSKKLKDKSINDIIDEKGDQESKDWELASDLILKNLNSEEIQTWNTKKKTLLINNKNLSSESWLNLFSCIIEINAFLLNISFKSKLNKVMMSNFDSLKTNEDFTVFHNYISKNKELDLLLKYLFYMIQTYLWIYKIEDSELKQWNDGLSNLLKNISLIKKDLADPKVSIFEKKLACYELQRLLLDNGPEEYTLLRKYPNQLTSVQEFIRYTHRMIYKKLSNYRSKGKKMETKLNIYPKSVKVYELDLNNLDRCYRSINIYEVGEQKNNFFKKFNKHIKECEYSEKTEYSAIVSNNFFIIDQVLGEHSLEFCFYSEQSKGNTSDANRIEVNLRIDKDDGNHFRNLFLYSFFKKLQEKNYISNMWNFNKSECNEYFALKASSIDYDKLDIKEMKLIYKIFNSITNLDQYIGSYATAMAYEYKNIKIDNYDLSKYFKGIIYRNKYEVVINDETFEYIYKNIINSDLNDLNNKFLFFNLLKEIRRKSRKKFEKANNLEKNKSYNFTWKDGKFTVSDIDLNSLSI